MSTADGWLTLATIPEAPRLKWLLRADFITGSGERVLTTFAVQKPWPGEKAVFALPVTDESWENIAEVVESWKVTGATGLYGGGVGLALARGVERYAVTLRPGPRGGFLWREDEATPGLYRHHQRRP